MPESFIPLRTMPASEMETAPFQLRVLPQAESQAAFEPLPDVRKAEPAPTTCARPSITLQRQGDIVSGIRIECACGQVIELACAY